MPWYNFDAGKGKDDSGMNFIVWIYVIVIATVHTFPQKKSEGIVLVQSKMN